MKQLFWVIFLGLFIGQPMTADAQVLKKLKKKVEKKLERKVDEKVDEEIDSLFEEGQGSEKRETESKEGNSPVPHGSSPTLELYSRYDFVPGDVVIFEDLVRNELSGEFPSKWDLNAGNVEIGTYDGEDVINFPSTSKAEIVPLMEEKEDYLPEKFTIEFDAFFSEFCTKYTINFYDVVNQKNITDLPYLIIDPWKIWIKDKGATEMERNDNYPYWQHIAISFNIRSLKVYYGENRIANIPNLKGNPSGFSIAGKQCHDGQLSMIRNVRIAKGSMNLYERVITDGKFITTGIRFDSGKATIKPESMGVINSIYKLMSEHGDLSFSVEGHTDSDGDEASNHRLSEDRAAAVKSLLVSKGIDASRLTTKGFGESMPVDANNTPEGKANNRRVEFIKF